MPTMKCLTLFDREHWNRSSAEYLLGAASSEASAGAGAATGATEHEMLLQHDDGTQIGKPGYTESRSDT